jgi:hypothetical protein
VAVQLPADVLADERSIVAGRGPSLRIAEREARAGAASVKSAQLATATNLMLTTKPPLASTTRRT